MQNLGSCALSVSGLSHPEDIKIENKKDNNKNHSVLLCTRPLVVESDKSDYLRGTFSILMLDHLNAKHWD